MTSHNADLGDVCNLIVNKVKQRTSIMILEERTVFVLGKTGGGKSNLINHLVRSNHLKSSDLPTATTKTIDAVRYTQTGGKLQSRMVTTIYDSPGFFDDTLDNLTIAKDLSHFFHYDLSFLNRAIICVHKAKLTGEFVESMKQCLRLFKPDYLKDFVTVCITNCPVGRRDEWLASFLAHKSIIDLMAQYSIDASNFIAVDLNRADDDYNDDIDEPLCVDSKVIQDLINSSSKRFHKSAIIQGLDINDDKMATLLERLSEIFK